MADSWMPRPPPRRRRSTSAMPPSASSTCTAPASCRRRCSRCCCRPGASARCARGDIETDVTPGARRAARACRQPVRRGAPALVRAAARAHGGAAARRAPGAAAGDPARDGRARLGAADRPPALAGDAARPRRMRAAGGARRRATPRSASGSSPTCRARRVTAFLSRMVPGDGAESVGGRAWYDDRDGELAAVRRRAAVRAAEGRGDGRGAGADADAVVDAAPGDRPQLGRARRSRAVAAPTSRTVAADALRLTCTLLDSPLPPELARHYITLPTRDGARA